MMLTTMLRGLRRAFARRPAGVRDPMADFPRGTPDLYATNWQREFPAPAPRDGALPSYYTPVFEYDGLRTDPAVIHNHDFMKDPRYVAAYARGIQAHGEHQVQYWRMHVALWCAAQATRLDGDFVECGVWKGFLSSGIMRYLDWNRLGQNFYLFDTFRGIDESLVTPAEVAKGNLPHYRKYYLENFEEVCRNFAEFRNVYLVRGSVPQSLRRCRIDRVAYLSLDMNNVTPEIAAIEYFWPKLVRGAFVLLDDYGFISYEEQKRAFDEFTQRKGVELLALPSGQGLFRKP
jgi:hypothetical protein